MVRLLLYVNRGYFGTQRNNAKTFSGTFCSNRGNQPIPFLDFAHLLPFKVK